MAFLTGLVALIVGAAVAAAGLPLFFLLLPVWGFVVGFLVGAGFMAAIFGGGFLATTLGIVVGLVFGVLFAVLSYLYWYVAVLLSAGATGFVLGAALMGTIGVSADWLIFIVGAVFAIGFVLVALALNYPVYLVIVLTSLAGSAIAIGGALVMFGQIDPAMLSSGELWRTIDDSWFLWLIWVVGAGVGIGAQLSAMSRVQLPEEKWVPVTEGR